MNLTVNVSNIRCHNILFSLILIVLKCFRVYKSRWLKQFLLLLYYYCYCIIIIIIIILLFSIHCKSLLC